MNCQCSNTVSSVLICNNVCMLANVCVWWVESRNDVFFCLCGFRYSITKAFCVAFLMTFFSVFDVPVFWPILLCYWIVLFVLTMKRQIMHMIKYKYIPFSIGKQVRAPPNIPLLKLNLWVEIFRFCLGLRQFHKVVMVSFCKYNLFTHFLGL